MAPARSVPLGEVAAAIGAPLDPASSTVAVSSVELDSNAVLPGALFAALPGRHAHGAAFAPAAIASGAVGVLTDAEGAALLAGDPAFAAAAVPMLVVDSPRAVLGRVSALVFGTAPADLAGMDLLAVTGTNGKTTVNAMLDAGLRAAGRVTGLVGTTGTVIAGERIPTARTTPEAPHLHGLLRRMLDAGASAASFEVSSIALTEGRVDGLVFTVAGFTNLTQDHLDYHGSMEAYFAAKAALFTPGHCSMAVIGIDDDHGRRLAAMVRDAGSVPLWTWSLADPSADWTLDGRIARGPDGTVVELDVPLPGEHNRANALLALAMLRRAGVDAHAAAAGIASVVVPGRMEVVATEPVRGIVDYAHSPDAIERVLAALRPSTPGRLIAVVGAGGDRDREKRPLMGAAAARLADIVVVTDDNPRSEDPAAIRAAVAAGAFAVAGVSGASGTRVVEMGDRAAAIRAAVGHASPLDTVVVLGKGHETGQEIAGTMHPFDDRIELAAALREANA